MRRAATREVLGVRFRGLKPTATIMGSLRDQTGLAAEDGGRRTEDGGRKLAIGNPSTSAFRPRVVGRGATSDGSRGFQTTDAAGRGYLRRGATGESGAYGGNDFMRRAATREVLGVRFRGLKPTATIMGSLRDQTGLAAEDGGRRTEDGGRKLAIGNPSTSAFTLIEFIGVLAVLAILATVLVPVVIKRVDIAAYNAEQSNLANMANALTLEVLRSNSIPGQANWSSALANWLSYPSANVATNARNNPRAYLIDPASWLPAAGYTQTAAGTNVTGDARVMFVSSIGAALPASLAGGSATDFSNLWNSTSGTLPTTGVWSGWSPPGHPADVLVQRANLVSLFHRLILNAEDTNDFGSYVLQIGAAAFTNYVFPNSPSNAWYLQGTVIGLYDTNNGSPNLEANVVVQADASYVFENTAWRGQLSGWGTNGPASHTAPSPSAGDAFSTLATQFTARGWQDSTPVILAGFYAFMMDYNAWSQYGFGSTGISTNILNALTNDAVRIQKLQSW